MSHTTGNGQQGSLIQLAAIGAFEVATMIKPQKTFWRDTYLRHSNYAVCEQPISGPTARYDAQHTFTIDRNGDLLRKLWIMTEVGPGVGNDGNAGAAGTARLTDSFGHAVFKEITLEIGGHVVNKLTGRLLEVINQLCNPAGLEPDELIGAYESAADGFTAAEANQRFYTEVPFYFSQADSQALPMIALQYHDVKVKITTQPWNRLAIPDVAAGFTSLDSTSHPFVDMMLIAQYVLCDTAERRPMAQVSHSYLIQQFQIQEDEPLTQTSTVHTVQSYANHAVKEVILVLQNLELLEGNMANSPASTSACQSGANSDIFGNEWFNWEATPGQSDDPLVSLKLSLNSQVRFDHDAKFLRVVIPKDFHSKIPNRFLYNYVFARDPEAWHPTGACEFSRIDNVVYQITRVATGTVAGQNEAPLRCGVSAHFYHINQNLAKISGGLFGVMFAN